MTDKIIDKLGITLNDMQNDTAHAILHSNKDVVVLSPTGSGKTLAYLVGCILWQMNRPERMKLPIVISTSSVALQDAILTEYLPDLSAILLDEGIITAPITAVVRKGKERFVCDARLAERASLVQPSRKRQTNSLKYDIQMIKNLGANFLTQLGTNILPYVREFAEAALPVVSEALEKIGGYMTGTIIPAAETAVKWISEHRTLILALAAGIASATVAFKTMKTAATAIKQRRRNAGQCFKTANCQVSGDCGGYCCCCCHWCPDL